MSNNIMKIIKLMSISMFITILFACSTTHEESMNIVGQSLTEGRLVPEAALENIDILNQYEHDYPENKQSKLVLRLDYNRKKIHTTGGKLLVQVGLLGEAIKYQPLNLHVLHYNRDDSNDDKKIVSEFIQQAKNELHKEYRDTNLSFDSAGPIKINTIAQVNHITKSQHNTLQDMLSEISLQPFSSHGHHFVLLLGNMNEPSQKVKQDLVDMARVIKAKGAKLSVLGYAEEPEFSLLSAIAEAGHGRYILVDEYYQFNRWLKQEMVTAHAEEIKNLTVSLRAINGAKFEEILSPRNIGVNGNKVSLNLEKMIGGSNYVLVASMSLPGIQKLNSVSPIEARVEYFDNKLQRYVSIVKKKSIEYTMDMNDAIPVKHDRIARSQLILKSQNSLLSAAKFIRSGRNYQAIAVLLEQKTKLDKFNKVNRDSELQRDAKILTQYAQNLQKFDEDYFQRIKIWRDMNWSNDRYSKQYQ